MSELIAPNGKYASARWKLLTGASALALTANLGAPGLAKADEHDRPAVWIELGGQFDFVDNPREIWAPSNLPPPIDHPVSGILGLTPHEGYDADAKLTLQPAIADWNFSVSVRYGNARRGPKFAHDQTYKTRDNGNKYVRTTYAFTDLHKVEETKHDIVDFQAGKDVGVGLFGSHDRSTVNFGVRIAQFYEKTDSRMTAQASKPFKYPVYYYYGTKNINANIQAQRSFSGIGPSISWNSSTPLSGTLDEGLAFDWGANAAILFGRQKAKVDAHNETDEVIAKAYTPVIHLISTVLTNSSLNENRSRTVVVPNIGAFAGISYRVGGRGKVSLGYRADCVCGAMHGGIDTHESEIIGLHDPFATISLGLNG